jgi:hypothetical protein
MEIAQTRKNKERKQRRNTAQGAGGKQKTKDNLARTDGVAIKKAIFRKQQTKIKDTMLIIIAL